MPREFSRARRIEEQIKRELASMISREVDAPQLGLVTFTAVSVTADLSLAKVYFTLLGAEVDEQTGEAIMNEASSHLRYCLSKVMTIRSVPRLRFYYDVSIERGNKMEALLDEISREENSTDSDS